EDHLRIAVCWWHTFCYRGGDMFGADAFERAWFGDDMASAERKVDAAFELFAKLGVPFFTFHDRDVAPEGATLRETNAALAAILDRIEQRMRETGVRLLWGTANLFGHPRYAAGAATNPDPEVFAYAAAQVKKAIEVTHRLGGAGYVFWGGREGYQCLWNTDMKRELDHLGIFMRMAVDYAKEIGFTGQFLIEPKPKEPTKHQYDFDAAACLNFLRQYDLMDVVKLNIETNHATLAGHSMMHELEYASIQGVLGSIDANTGDLLLGWDTDQFPTDIYLTTQIMLVIMKQGGLQPGGTNFDAKVRRESIDPVDLFYAHIGGMDAFARGLKIAAAIRAEGVLDQFVRQRYSSYDAGIGQQIEAGTVKFGDLESYMLEKGDAAANSSGRQEMLENLINRYI
ncbi:MAG: xylose isomerase, partial [Planctomycetaceae bacterium]